MSLLLSSAPPAIRPKIDGTTSAIIIIVIAVIFIFIFGFIKSQCQKEKTSNLEERIKAIENSTKENPAVEEAQETKYSKIEEMSEEEKQQALDYINSLKKK